MTDEELLRKAALARQNAVCAEFQQSFADYGYLLGTMSPAEFAVEIGAMFQAPKQAAIITVMLARICALEERFSGKDAQ